MDAARHRPRLAASACMSRNAASSRIERDDGLHPGAAARTPALQRLSSRAGLRRRQPLARLGQFGRGDRTASCSRLAHGARRQARAGAGGAFRDALHDAPGDGVHRRGGGDGRPWCLHLSYIKPHWPYIAPAPYNAHVRRAATCCPPCAPRRSAPSRTRSIAPSCRPAPSRAFARDEVRERVVPGLHGPDQADRRPDRRAVPLPGGARPLDSTMIVFTSDHGDYLGDHWLGEKDLFHELLGEDSADHLRSVGGSRRDARHGVRCAGRGDRPRADLPRMVRRRPPQPHVMEGPLAAAVAARRDARRVAQLCVLRIRLLDAGRRG